MNNIIVFIVIFIGLALVIYILYKSAIKIRQLFWDIHVQLKDIYRQVIQSENHINRLSIDVATKGSEIQNAIYLSQLDFRIPVFMGGWSIDTFLGKYLVQHIINEKPRTILELGSGSSTLIIAKTIQIMNLDNYTHIAVDHEEKYLEISREYARLNGLEDSVTWLECPLVNNQEYEKLWYGGLIEHLKEIKIDLLVIDGPPGVLQTHSRYPALPCLYPYLSEKCVIVLDDANREDEQYIARKWIEKYPEFNLNFIHDGHGIAVIYR